MKSHIPTIATYRLQLSPSFGFDAAAGIIDYLAALGISHLYLSPVFEARPGSSHGYDQTDPGRLRGELGGRPAFERLLHKTRNAGLGIVVDIVPNHMAAHQDNPLWFGLLRHGRQSEFARYFDVDWDFADEKVILPFLGAPLADVIAKGELSVLETPDRGMCLRYYDNLFPLREDTGDSSAQQTSEPLDKVLERQHYELLFWREGITRANYRRFFNISDLPAVRIEDPLVFEHIHRGVLDLVRQGVIDGIRIDHIDGLADPLQYLRRLRGALDEAAPAGARVWVVVEKILAVGESLPGNWPVQGTTGYDFLAATTNLMTDPGGIAELRRNATKRFDAPMDFHAMSVACKQEIATTRLVPELDRLCSAAAERLRAFNVEFQREELRDLLVKLSSNLTVYRTYADEDGMKPSDVALVHAAAARAANADPALRRSPLFSKLVQLLTLADSFAAQAARAAALPVVRIWQQFTGPLAAKGVEDTAIYRDVASPALCDVGCEPVPADADAMLRHVLHQRASFHLSMNATDTHDMKRSADVRARLAVLTRTPRPWISLLDDLIPAVESHFEGLDPAPSREDLVRIANAAFALWPEDDGFDQPLIDRLNAFLTKAVREAKSSSSWIDSRPEYEAACARAMDALLTGDSFASLRARFAELLAHSRPLAAKMSLGMVILKSLLPGMPDYYQGTELRSFALADPDNRRPVDYVASRAHLKAIQDAWDSDPATAATTLLAQPASDRAKLFVTWRSLTVRRHLLAHGEITMRSFASSPERWSFRISAGDLACEADVILFSDPLASEEPQSPSSGGINQITGEAVDSPKVWTRIVIPGLTSLID